MQGDDPKKDIEFRQFRIDVHDGSLWRNAFSFIELQLLVDLFNHFSADSVEVVNIEIEFINRCHSHRLWDYPEIYY